MNYATISRNFSVLTYTVTQGTKFSKSSLQKIVFSKRITALLTFKSQNKCKIDSSSFMWHVIVKEDW